MSMNTVIPYRKLKAALAFVIAFLLFSFSSSAQTWTGSVSTSWTTASNWSPFGVPTGDVIIPGSPASGRMPTLSTGTNTITSLTIQSGATLTISGGVLNLTASPSLTVNAGGVITQTGGTLSLVGTTSLSGTFNQSAGTVLGSQTIAVNTGGIINQSGGLIHMASSTFTVPTDKLTIASGATVNQSGGTMNFKDYTGSPGTFNQTGSGALVRIYHDWKPGTGSVFNSTAGTVEFAGNAASPNFTAGSFQFNNIIIDAGVNPVFDNVAGSVITFSGDYTNNNTALAIATDPLFVVNGSGTQNIYSASTGTTFNNITLSKSSGNVVLQSDINVSGNWTNNGSAVTVSNYSVTFTTGGGTIGGTAPTAFPAIYFASSAGAYTMSNSNSCTSLTINASSTPTSLVQNSGTTLTVNGDVTIYQPIAGATIATWNINAASAIVSGNVNLGGNGTNTGRIAKIVITSGSLDVAGNINYNSAATIAQTAVIDMSGGAGTLRLAGNINLTNGSGTLTPGTSSTVVFNGAGAQTITTGSAIAYNHITVNKASSTATLDGSKTVANVTISQGTLDLSGNTLTVTGNWTNNGSFTSNGTITFAGSSSQSLGGSASTTFNNLTVNNGAGITLTNNQTINGTLTFTAGRIITGSYVLTCGTASTVNGAGPGTGYVIGNLAIVIPVGATAKTFSIGSGYSYTPVDLTFTGITTGGTLTASTTGTDHPNLGSSDLNASTTVNRYWKLTNSGLVFTSYSATFNFVSGDVDAGVTTGLLELRRYNSGWSTPTVGTRTSVSTQATGLTAFGDFQIGQYNSAPTLTSIAPNNGLAGRTMNITLTGTGFVSGFTTVNAGAGITVNSVTFNSSTQIVANITIASGATIGARNISVTVPAPGGGTSGTQAFTVGFASSWTGAVSTAWSNAANWSGGVPTSSVDAIIGDVNFTGSYQPTVDAAAVCKSLTVGGTVASTLTVSTLNLTVSGDVTINANGTISHTSTGIIQLTGNWSNAGTYTAGATNVPVVFAGTTLLTGSTTFGKFTINNGATVTQSAGTIRVKDPTINAGGVYQHTGGTLQVDHDWKNSGTYTSTGGTIQFVTSASGSATFLAGTNQFYNVVINPGVDPGFNNDVGGLVSISGNFTNNNSALAVTTNLTTTFNGTGSQTITSLSAGASFGNIVVNKASGSISLLSDIYVSGNWTNNGSAANVSAYSITFTGAANTIGGTASTNFSDLHFASGAVYTMNNSNSCISFTIDPVALATSFTQSAGTTLTVNGDVTISQPTASVIAAWNINSASASVSGNVNIGGTATTTGRVAKIVITTGSLDIAGDLVYNSAASTAQTAVIDMSGGAGNLYVAGNFVLTNSSGTLTPGTSSTVTFDGTADQNIADASAVSYSTLKVNKTSGTLYLTTNLNLNSGSLVLDRGILNTTSVNNYSLTATNITLNSGSLILNNSALTVTGNLTNSGTAITGGTSVITVNGNYTRNGGTLDVPSGSLMLGGNFVNHNTNSLNIASVTFTGTGKYIYGSVAPVLPAVYISSGTVAVYNTTLTCSSLTFTNNALANSLTLYNAASKLTVNGNVVINQATANVVHALNVNAGTANITGDLTFNVTASNAGRTATVAITTGTLTVGGNVTMNNTLLAGNSIIDMSGGAGTLYIGGNFTVSSLGTLTPGTSSTVVYNGTGAQNVATLSAVSYNSLTIQKSSGTATLDGALTINNVTLASGTFSTSASNYTINLAGNWTNNGGTLSGGTSTVNLTNTGTIGGTNRTTFPAINVNATATNYTLANDNSCSSLTFAASATATSFTHSGTASLTVNGAVIMAQPTTTGITCAWNINGGSATVSGLISFPASSNTATRVEKIAITTGTLNANGGISFSGGGTSAASRVIDMSGGAGTLNLKGALTFTSGATLTAGTSGSIFNYADNSAAQTINFFTAGAYYNLYCNNTSASGVTLSGAITTTNVTGDFRVQSGTTNNGGFAVALNTGKTFEVVNGATYKVTGTSGMVTGTSITKTFGPNSTVEYNSSSAQSISAENYGNLIISGSRGANSVTFASSGTIGIAGTFSPVSTFQHSGIRSLEFT